MCCAEAIAAPSARNVGMNPEIDTRRIGILQARAVVVHYEFHIDGIAVAQRDRRLQPLEFHFPGAAERVGSRVELAKVLHQVDGNSCEAVIETEMALTAFERE